MADNLGGPARPFYMSACDFTNKLYRLILMSFKIYIILILWLAVNLYLVNIFLSLKNHCLPLCLKGIPVLITGGKFLKPRPKFLSSSYQAKEQGEILKLDISQIFFFFFIMQTSAHDRMF